MRRIGTYELLRRLGSGGMAEVWMARRVAAEGITKSVALKLLTSRAGDERYRRMFIDEARLSMLLNHSNIVQVFDVGVDQGIYFLAMEWVDGLNLAQLRAVAEVRDLAISDALAAHIVGELLQALAYAHTVTHEGRPLALIHRDVSPQNVLVSLSGGIKLADFGIARLAHDETSGLHVKGKLRYMAPEQLSGASRAPTVDLYAVGAILHELLGGVRFREGDDEAAIIAQISAAEIPPLTRTDVAPELEALRRGLLEPDPALRIQSAVEALDRLAAWPGYRNETLALARLCRACAGVEAPRASVEVEPEAAASTIVQLYGGASGVSEASEGRPRRPSPIALAALGGVLIGGLALALTIFGDRSAPSETPAELVAPARTPERANDANAIAPLPAEATDLLPVAAAGEGAASPIAATMSAGPEPSETSGSPEPSSSAVAGRPGGSGGARRGGARARPDQGPRPDPARQPDASPRPLQGHRRQRLLPLRRRPPPRGPRGDPRLRGRAPARGPARARALPGRVSDPHDAAVALRRGHQGPGRRRLRGLDEPRRGGPPRVGRSLASPRPRAGEICHWDP
ncbi:MAG: protein kinase [Myxococcales bacterium]|nr:protein kinase [Myxococcales bacterium]